MALQPLRERQRIGQRVLMPTARLHARGSNLASNDHQQWGRHVVSQRQAAKRTDTGHSTLQPPSHATAQAFSLGLTLRLESAHARGV